MLQDLLIIDQNKSSRENRDIEDQTLPKIRLKSSILGASFDNVENRFSDKACDKNYSRKPNFDSPIRDNVGKLKDKVEKYVQNVKAHENDENKSKFQSHLRLE